MPVLSQLYSAGVNKGFGKLTHEMPSLEYAKKRLSLPQRSLNEDANIRNTGAARNLRIVAASSQGFGQSERQFGWSGEGDSKWTPVRRPISTKTKRGIVATLMCQILYPGCCS